MKILIQTLFFFLLVTQICFGQQVDQIIEHNGAKIHYKIVGDGKPILLLSGGPGFSLDYMSPIADLYPIPFSVFY